MKRVGILTLYHGSLNYGGVLQAYALCKALEQMDIPCEQIRCAYTVEEESREPGQLLKKLLDPRVVLRRIRYERNRLHAEKLKAGRRQAFAAFQESHIPSSGRVYTSADISECLPEYSAFVTGSDQVWNPDWYCPTLFLDFVPEGVPKIAYAASLGKSSLTQAQQSRFREHLKDFAAVSVREAEAVEIVEPLSPVNVEHTLDPTLLLTREQWDEVCAPRLVEGPYLFCYFLGDDAGKAELAEAYARKKGLRIVGIPYILSNYSETSKLRYDIPVRDASPADFLSLVKYASCVFTDSFHATVFSCIYHTEHFTFTRAGHSGMSGRIRQVSSLFQTEDHFCGTREACTPEHLERLEPIDFDREFPELERVRKKSLDYLKAQLSGAGEKE